MDRVGGSPEKNSREKSIKQLKGLAGVFEEFSSGFIEPLEWVMQVVNLIYLEKYFADLEDIKEGRVIKPMREYTIEWFLCKFGIRKYSEVLLRDFVKSLVEYSKDYERFKLFAQFLGISLNGKQLDLARGDIKKAFYLSPDVNYFVCRLIYRFRNGCSPYLPGLQVKNPTTLKLLEDLGNFVNLEKAKHIFVVFMGENGIQEDKLKDVSELLRKTADQEPKHIERYAALKEGADLKKMISFDGLLSALINHYVNIRVKEIEHFKASFQILDTGSEFIINFEEYANAVKRAQPKRSERWIEQTFHFLKESRGYEAISANDAISRLVPWLGDSLSVGIWKVDSPENITNELHPIKKGEKKVVTTKLMKDPLTNIFMLDQTFKIMKQVLLSAESQKNEQSKALEQIKLGTQNLISQFVSGDFTYSVSSDPTVEIWKRFRRFLEAIQSK